MAKLSKTSTPGIFRRHKKGCGGGKCGCAYVVVWRHRGKQSTETFKTFAEAREAQGGRQAGDRRPTAKITFGVYFPEWIANYAGRTARGFSETTRPEYERPIKAEALDRWRDWKLGDIESADVRELFGSMRRKGRSSSAIRKLRAALSALFATAVEDGLIRANPVTGVRIPGAEVDEEPVDEQAKALTREELRLLLAAVPEDWRLFFDLLAVTGLRISEQIGLRWAHVDLGEHPHLEIREQFYRGKRKRLKSGAGRRDIPLSPSMADRLLRHRRDKFKGADSPVFPSTVGTPLIQGKVRTNQLAKAAIAVGLYEEVEGKDGKPRKRPTVGFHTFRHTCASMLFDEGRNIKQVQTWLGHADPAFTLRTYVHLLDAGVGDGLEPPARVNTGSTGGSQTVESDSSATAGKSPF